MSGGQSPEPTAVKAFTARDSWCAAVNNHGGFGRWGYVEVTAIQHGDKRANLPTADAHDFVGPGVDALRQVRYPRDPSLDPQLVWRGKDEQDTTDLLADAPPINIQEKIDPRVLAEHLRTCSATALGR